MINSEIKQANQESNLSINSQSRQDYKKKGYYAGIISLFICIIFVIMVVNLGWDLTGQILTAFSALFGILGIGSLISPELVGQITYRILEQLGKNSN